MLFGNPCFFVIYLHCFLVFFNIKKATVCDHKSTLPPDSPENRLLDLRAAVVLQTHQRTEVAASFRQKLAKPSPLEPNQVARLSQKVEGDSLLP